MSIINGIIKAPVSQSDIKMALGITTGSLAEACQSDSINPRAAFKPMNIASYQALTVAQRKAENYGMAVSMYYNPIELARGVVAGTAWSYDKPKAPYFRRLDFNGYNHNAIDWLTCGPQSDKVAVNGAVAMDLYGNGDALSESINALSELLELGYLASYSATELNFGFLLRDAQFTANTYNCYYIPLTGVLSIRELVNNGKITIPANTLNSAGKWYILPVLTTATYEQGKRVYFSNTESTPGVWWPIPYSSISSVEMATNVQNYPIDMYITIRPYSADVTNDGRGVITLSNVVVEVVNTDTTTGYNVVISDAVISSGVMLGKVSLHGGSVNVGASSTATVTIQSSAIEFEIADPSLERISINITYYLDGYSAEKRTAYIYIELV